MRDEAEEKSGEGGEEWCGRTCVDVQLSTTRPSLQTLLPAYTQTFGMYSEANPYVLHTDIQYLFRRTSICI